MAQRTVYVAFCLLLALAAALGGLPEADSGAEAARPTSLGWQIETVDSDGDVGPYNSLALDADGYPHVSYQDWTNTALKYAWKDYVPPEADFTGTPTSGPAPLTVVFTNTSTGDYDTSLWLFGDGITSTIPNPTYIYPAAGTYTVTLTISGPGGTDTEIKERYITATYGIYLPVLLRGD